MEKLEGLPVAPFMDREKVFYMCKLYSSQLPVLAIGYNLHIPMDMPGTRRNGSIIVNFKL